MAIGDSEWLEQTQEPPLDPDLPICDPHHHLWVHRPEPLAYQQYLLPELMADLTSGHNVLSTVFIEVSAEYRTDGPDEMRSVGEVEFVDKLVSAGQVGSPRAAAAIIGKADLILGNSVRPVLEALASASPDRFRGIRHSVGWDANPEILDREIQGALSTQSYRDGARLLSDLGFILENSLYFPQLGELADFATAIPDLTIVVNHIGGLLRIGPYANKDDEVLEEWRRGIATLSNCSNVVMKLGGVGQARYGFDWSQRSQPVGSEELSVSLKPLMEYCIEQFGVERCMFESNFPVDKVSYSYNVVYNAFKRLSMGYSSSERAALFHDNAVRIYSIAQ